LIRRGPGAPGFREAQDFNFDLDADFADFADLFAGFAYLPGAFFGASTFAIFYFLLIIYYWDLKLAVLSAGAFAMPHSEASERQVRFNFC